MCLQAAFSFVRVKGTARSNVQLVTSKGCLLMRILVFELEKSMEEGHNGPHPFFPYQATATTCFSHPRAILCTIYTYIYMYMNFSLICNSKKMKYYFKGGKY